MACCDSNTATLLILRPSDHAVPRPRRGPNGVISEMVSAERESKSGRVVQGPFELDVRRWAMLSVTEPCAIRVTSLPEVSLVGYAAGAR